jgi:hypothetical protein
MSFVSEKGEQPLGRERAAMLMRGEALMPTMMRRSANVVLQARFPHMRLDEGYMHSRALSRDTIVELLRV